MNTEATESSSRAEERTIQLPVQRREERALDGDPAGVKISAATSIASSGTHATTFWFALDGDDPFASARALVRKWLAFIEERRVESFSGWTGDIWIGRRSDEGVFLPQFIICAVGESGALHGEMFGPLATSELLLEYSPGLDPIEMGLFPDVHCSQGELQHPWRMDVDFLLSSSRQYRHRHKLVAQTRDPYAQLAGRAMSLRDFVWATADGRRVHTEDGAVEIIEGSSLRVEEIPAAGASWSDLVLFAGTFDGFEEFGSAEAAYDAMDTAKGKFDSGVSLSLELTLPELRNVLFLDCTEQSPVPVAPEPFLASVLEAIRSLVASQVRNSRRLREAFERDHAPASSRRVSHPVAAIGGSSARRGVPAFDELDSDEQSILAHEQLFQKGPMEKPEAVRLLASLLRDAGQLNFQRLRQDGPIYALMEAVLDNGVRLGIFDRPRRAWVRAVLSDARMYSKDHWRWCLLGPLTAEPVDRDEAVRMAAEWGREQLGLSFERLREGGIIDKGLRSAINSAVRRGEVERVGSQSIRRMFDTAP